MDRIFEAIEEWMRNLLTGMVSSNLTTMYTDVNEKTGQIAAQVGQTPQGWNVCFLQPQAHFYQNPSMGRIRFLDPYEKAGQEFFSLARHTG